jgi:hypothetical protein
MRSISWWRLPVVAQPKLFRSKVCHVSVLSVLFGEPVEDKEQ